MTLGQTECGTRRQWSGVRFVKPNSIPRANSAEHLIPNAIGGRRKVMGFICRECNSSAGETWDAEVARQLLWLSLMVGVSRERGQLPSLKVITTADERLTIRSDGSLALSDPSFKEAQLAEGRTSYRIQARSMNEAQRMMEGLKRKHPEIDVDSLLAQAEVAETYPRGAIRHDFEFGGELGGRSIVKSCMALAFDSGIDWAVCEPGLNYLRKNNAPACFGYYQERDLVAQRVEGVPLHCVAVRANPESGLVLAYAEYFGIHRIVACLGENYEGRPWSPSMLSTPVTERALMCTSILHFRGRISMTSTLTNVSPATR